MPRITRPARTGPITWISLKVAERMMGGDEPPSPSKRRPTTRGS